MDLQARKLSIIEWLSSLEDQNILQKIEGLMRHSFHSSESVLSPMTGKEYVAMLDKAEQAILDLSLIHI